ncbi:SRPBCC family protein [Methylobacillus sp.]|uniref:SRPBCC family protein n=1 Tax=Methylobacillus sp. TaxID=56818 RepID=UPI0012C8CC81|nr:SRPBCC family protein [Methylobacillus sp.]MPS49558.1 SRPBCC family protein [Methylobacillus sp.]
MPRLENTIDIKVPVNIAYNQWTQFETFPNFMSSVLQVKQLDDSHVWWQVEIGGHSIEWEAEIIEQVPDDHIAWRSVSSPRHLGLVSFKHVEIHATRVHVEIEYEADMKAEVSATMTGLLEQKISEALACYRQLLESRKRPAGGWRGRIAVGTDNAVRH